MSNKDKYESRVKDKLELVKGWAMDGLDNKQIAHNLGIGITSLYKYQKEYPEFCDALKKGKEVADYEIENALFKRAKGYTAYEIVEEMDRDTGQMITTKRIRKSVAPDTAAAIFWLKNRRPGKWSDRKEIASDDAVQVVINNDLPKDS